MKLAEVVAQFIAQQGVNHVFGVSGGASLHLIHGIVETTQVSFIPTAHEAGAGFAADAYARLRGLGVALATSGPGATNLVTSIAAAYYDSCPVLFLTGNTATFRFGIPLGVRQYGFQEGPIADMVRPVTKYAVCVTDPKRILYELGKAIWHAQEGRKGPVLVDIPDDLQRADVDVAALQRFPAMPPTAPQGIPPVNEALAALQEARRPIFVWGAGVRPYADEALRLAERLCVPVACTWGAIDLLPAGDDLMAGGFGTHGNRGANFAVQNADLVISLGSRLDTKATGNPAHFARGAKIVMVDIDRAEIAKFKRLGRKIDLGIHADAGAFVAEMLHRLRYAEMPKWREWRQRVGAWKSRYPSRDAPEWRGTKPYALVRRLAESIAPEDIIVSDTGTALGYLMQAYPFKGERFIHAFNATPMGYGLPGAIGASFATGRQVVLVTGDGSSLMSLGELATVARHSLPIRIVLLNNKGHAMCRQTQRQWLGGNYPATSIEGGLGFPDFKMLGKSFGVEIEEYEVDPAAQLMPQARFGAPIEDGEPLLPREEFKTQMIVEPLET